MKLQNRREKHEHRNLGREKKPFSDKMIREQTKRQENYTHPHTQI